MFEGQTFVSILHQEIPVHEHGFVKVVDYMGGDHSIVNGARMSYQKGTKKQRDDAKLINFLWRNEHRSPFELPCITFHIKLPIFVMRQLARYRTAKMNEMSLRYSEATDHYFTPDLFRKNTSANKQSSEVCEDTSFQTEATKHYASAITTSEFEYHYLLQEGVARELARCVLPVAAYTEVVWCMDLRNLFNFLHQRLDPHAQQEIQDYAKVIAEIVKVWCPLAYNAFQEYTLNGLHLSAFEQKLVNAICDQDHSYVKFLLEDQDLWENGLWKEKSTEVKDLFNKMQKLGLWAKLDDLLEREDEDETDL